MPRSLHVQCTFNVRSLSAHCERMVPVVKSMRSVEGRRGKCNRLYFWSPPLQHLSLQLLQRASTLLRVLLVDEILGPLYLHPKTNPRTPSLTLGHCLVVRTKEVDMNQNPAPPQWQKTPNIELGGKGHALICQLSSISKRTLVQDFVHQPSRKSISFCFRPAGHIHIQHTHSLHATMLHAPAQRDKYEGNRPGQSGVSRYVVCLESMG